MEVNKIYNIDCLEFMKGMESNSVDLILTDPPYGMNFQSNHRKQKYEKISNDCDLKWLPSFVSESFRVLKGNSILFAFCSFHNIDIFKQELQKYFDFKNILIWEKNNVSMGDLNGDFAPKYEMICFCAKGRRELNGGRDSNILKSKRTGNEYHPTQKPTDLIEFLIKKAHNPNKLFLTLFWVREQLQLLA